MRMTLSPTSVMLVALKGADIGAEVTGHLVVGMVADDGVGIVVAGGGPVGFAGVGAEIAGPDQGVAGDPVGEALGDVELGVIGAGFGDSQLRDGGDGEVPGEVLQNDVFRMDNGQGHHVAVHHKEGTLTVDGQILVSLHQQADGLDGVLDGVGVGGVVLPGVGLILVDVVLTAGEFQGDGFSLVLQCLCGLQSLLDGHGAVGSAGGVCAVIQRIDYHGFADRLRRGPKGHGRHSGHEHAEHQHPCQKSSCVFHVSSSCL